MQSGKMEDQNDGAHQSLPISGRVAITFSCTGLMVSNFISLSAARSAGSTFPLRVLNEVLWEAIGSLCIVAAVALDLLNACLSDCL